MIIFGRFKNEQDYLDSIVSSDDPPDTLQCRVCGRDFDRDPFIDIDEQFCNDGCKAAQWG